MYRFLTRSRLHDKNRVDEGYDGKELAGPTFAEKYRDDRRLEYGH
jgi:hypothetical protein